jgi:cellulose synthase/poly-beta-1,6-N-acetylglucosamine synthase-like glycosyltransferase
MVFGEYVFIASLLLIFYNYIGYAVIAFLINKIVPVHRQSSNSNEKPTVSFIVAAYNEEDVIERKIINSLEQNYPSEKIEFIFITDGSTDNTNLILQKYPHIKLLYDAQRSGKSAALNRAIAAAANDVLIMSDANTFLNRDAVSYIAMHYNLKSTGGVAGEKKVLTYAEDLEGVGSREGLYWKYESFLKRIDSDFYSVVGAAGELFSIRRNLYEPIPDFVILDDFIISLKVAEKGYRIIYEPRAYATELSSVSVSEEKKRKIRIAAGGFQAMAMLGSLFYFWKHWRLSFLYISHRVLRWTISPLCLVTLFISNAILVFTTRNYAYEVIFGLQVLFYLSAFFSRFISPTSKFKFLKIAGYFSFMNFSVFLGFFRFISRKKSAVWEK